MDGEKGFNGNSSLVNLTAISPGIPCQFGGIQIQSGIDLNHNQFLDEEEIQTTAHVCDGQLGEEGPEGQQGTDGAQGYSALIDRRAAPSSICPQGVIMRFGVDDGTDMAIADDGILHDDEVRESLQICSEQLYEGYGDYSRIQNSCHRFVMNQNGANHHRFSFSSNRRNKRM